MQTIRVASLMVITKPIVLLCNNDQHLRHNCDAFELATIAGFAICVICVRQITDLRKFLNRISKSS